MNFHKYMKKKDSNNFKIKENIFGKWEGVGYFSIFLFVYK